MEHKNVTLPWAKWTQSKPSCSLSLGWIFKPLHSRVIYSVSYSGSYIIFHLMLSSAKRYFPQELISIVKVHNKVSYFQAHKTHFFPQKMWPKFDLHLVRRGLSIISKLINTRTFIIQHLYHEILKTTMKMILVAVTMIFWVSVMNKLYYGC